MIFIDTNVAIDLRDSAATAGPRLKTITPSPHMSAVSWIELEGGVHRVSAAAAARRSLLDLMLTEIEVVMLTPADIRCYGQLVAKLGFDRRRILDRLIAAQVITNRAMLLTANARDFHEIEGLNLIEW
ncbi:MAG: type II toxin-antitoxin system VapC family toxin [Sandaracinobacter sp.]